MPPTRSQDCTLILTEGDSAKTLAVSGLGVVGRDRYGVFPLKGKLLNVRDATNPQVLKNEEIQVKRCEHQRYHHALVCPSLLSKSQVAQHVVLTPRTRM